MASTASVRSETDTQAWACGFTLLQAGLMVDACGALGLGVGILHVKGSGE